jgi:hypothetical protein
VDKKKRSWKSKVSEQPPELVLPPAVRAAGGKPPDPAWYQSANQRARECRERYESGDKVALFDAMEIWVEFFPPWGRNAFRDAWRAYREGQVKTLEQAFGIKWSQAARKREYLRERVLFRVYELHREGRPIDRGLFSKVGAEIGCSGSTVDRIFSESASDELREVLRRLPLDEPRKR